MSYGRPGDEDRHEFTMTGEHAVWPDIARLSRWARRLQTTAIGMVLAAVVLAFIVSPWWLFELLGALVVEVIAWALEGEARRRRRRRARAFE